MFIKEKNIQWLDFLISLQDWYRKELQYIPHMPKHYFLISCNPS